MLKLINKKKYTILRSFFVYLNLCMYITQMTSSTNFSIKRIYVTVLSLGLIWLTVNTILLNQEITKMITNLANMPDAFAIKSLKTKLLYVEYRHMFLINYLIYYTNNSHKLMVQNYANCIFN